MLTSIKYKVLFGMLSISIVYRFQMYHVSHVRALSGSASAFVSDKAVCILNVRPIMEMSSNTA